MNPLALLEDVHKWYVRYLRSDLFIRDPALRASFAAALDDQVLAKGPFLESTPRYRFSETLGELLASVMPDVTFDRGFLNAVNADRPLYRHQGRAVRLALEGQHAVVATGTGSGKTEAFLLPILVSLYREYLAGTLDEPGVRALILYPMNALVNDQRRRLGEIRQALGDSAGFGFSFGQYIGATPDSPTDTFRGGSEVERGAYPGESLYRQDMQRNPPHILITNYSMLEYLLIRPSDSPLFDGGRAWRWRFLIVDEAHQYRGSKGAEIAMLLRRLKERLRTGGRVEPLTCMATSASLTSDPENLPEVARFASVLFGEPVQREGVVTAEEEPNPSFGSKTQDSAVYAQWRRELEQGVISPAELGTRVLSDRRAGDLVAALQGGPKDVPSVASMLFSSGDREVALDDLIACLVAASDEAGRPVVSLRYHYFLRALSDVRIAFTPTPTVVLGDGSPGERASLDLALCGRCGQHYLVGRMEAGFFVHAVLDPGHDDFGATFLRPLGDVVTRSEAARPDRAGDPEDTDPNDEDAAGRTLALCPVCGSVAADATALSCSHEELLWVEEQRGDDEHPDRLKSCSVCEHRGNDPVREVTHGLDGPHAVIATALFADLPASSRKILAFADSRQRAAFFAWYLSDTYDRMYHRHLLLETARSFCAPGESYGLADLAGALREHLRASGVYPASATGSEVATDAFCRVLGEAVSDERHSLCHTGLLDGWLELPEWVGPAVSKFAARSGLSADEAQETVRRLLETAVLQRAVAFDTKPGVNVDWTHPALPHGYPRDLVVGAPRGIKQVISWDSARGRRQEYLRRLLGIDEDEAGDLLRQLLEDILAADRLHADDAVLSKGQKTGLKVHLRWWRFGLPERLWRCDVCQWVSTRHVRGVCPTFGCPGRLHPVSEVDLEGDHYRTLYAADLPGRLRAEEHTAQISREQAAQFQELFKSGEIQVLSSSTTFELGVDLGDLNTVFLRNVPPEPFNYAQRVGRAGRRTGHPGVAITYCGRSPHDLYHFREPERIISGQTRPPAISLENERLALRHVAALALSEYFRSSDERKSRFGVVASFLGDMDHADVVDDLRRFLDREGDRLERKLRDVVPAAILGPPGSEPRCWVEKITGPESRLVQAIAEVASDYRAAKDLELLSQQSAKYSDAEWAKKRAETIATQDVLSFLSQRAVIPKYGFPVDVVALDTLGVPAQGKGPGVLLQRDLTVAISEFAPGAEVIANKSLWRSAALKRVAGREWPRFSYRACREHGLFQQATVGQKFASPACCDKMEHSGGEYVVPQFGFTTDRTTARRPSRPPTRLYSTRPYLVDQQPAPSDQDFALPASDPAIAVRSPSPGRIAVVCEGYRKSLFRICSACGAAAPRLKKKHGTPVGGTCTGSQDRLSLGHSFVTDVLRLEVLLPGAKDLVTGLAAAYALQQAAAEMMDVPATDLDALAFVGSHLTLVLYDNVPGGAGLVAWLAGRQRIHDCLVRALGRVSGACGCPADSSCYGCLRTYQNQFVHHLMARGSAQDLLQTVLSRMTDVAQAIG